MFLQKSGTAVRHVLSGVAFSHVLIAVLCLSGTGAIVAGAWRLKAPVNKDGIMKSAAMAALVDSGESLCADIARAVEPAMRRTKILAANPQVIAALKAGNTDEQTRQCNLAIANATEIDAVALFNSSGDVTAINTIYASGKPIPAERVSRITGRSFLERNIIQSCVRNDSSEGALEFQTTCDITPAFFDSTGLSVACSMPVMDPQTGKKLGVVSSRMRFERLTGLIERRAIGGKKGSTQFVTDKGGYFSEEINSGRRQPPIPTKVLAGIVEPLVRGNSTYCFTQQGTDYVCLFRLQDFTTLLGGGIQIMVVADEGWLAREVRQAEFFNCGVLICLGLFMFLCAMVVRAMMSLRQKENWNRLLIESSRDGVIAVDDEQRVRNWNPKAQETFGYNAEEAHGRKLAELIQAKDRGIAKVPGEAPAFLVPSTGKADAPLEFQAFRKDGTEITVESVVRPLELTKRRWLCVFMRDVTEERATETHLSQVQKLESIGQMAAGIAHEINTPTQYVGDNTRFLRDSFLQILSVMERQNKLLSTEGAARPWRERHAEIESLRQEVDLDFLNEEIPKALDQSIEGLSRIARIVRAMKEFSHPGGDTKDMADLNAAIQSTSIVCQNRWKMVGKLELELDPALPAVAVLLGEFNQVILNLIVNSADAIAELQAKDSSHAGMIRISTRSMGDQVQIRVSDNGPGIPPQAAKRIFEPFFTTKPVGKGTGQGLMLSRAVIVKKHGGELRFEAAPGGGTVFIITLPVGGAVAKSREAA